MIGALTGEVVRRVTGLSIQEIHEERIRAPYGLDFHLGLPEALEARYADVLPMSPTPEQAELLAADAVRRGRHGAGRCGDVRRGGQSGRRPGAAPEAETVTEFARVHYRGPDLVTGNEDAFGLGFEELSGRFPFLGPDAFGHSGATGSLGFADPDSGVAYAYTRRRFGFPSGYGAGPENHRLAEAAVLAAGGR